MARVKEHCENLAQDKGVIITEAQLSRTLQKEIDRLTAKNAKLIKAFEGCSRCKDQYEAEIKAKDKAIAAQEEYIVLLGEELNETVAYAYTHGWKSTRHEAGKKLRARIKQALKG